MTRRDRTSAGARPQGPEASGRAGAAEQARPSVPETPPAPRRRARRAPAAGVPDADGPWSVELHTERTGLLSYRYRRLLVERDARGARARELLLELDHDEDQDLLTRKRDLLRQRGRALDDEAAAGLWRRIRALHPERLLDRYPCLDDVDPAQLDPAVGIDGEPIAVSTGEEGPACLTLRWLEAGVPRTKRILVARYRDPSRALARRRAAPPLAKLCALVDADLRGEAPLTHRRTAPRDLALEVQALKGVDFLNLRRFERHAVEALGSLGDGGAVPLLAAALFASDSRVRLGALDALAAIGDDAVGVADDVELLTHDSDGPVRERARYVLAFLRAPVLPAEATGGVTP